MVSSCRLDDNDNITTDSKNESDNETDDDDDDDGNNDDDNADDDSSTDAAERANAQYDYNLSRFSCTWKPEVQEQVQEEIQQEPETQQHDMDQDNINDNNKEVEDKVEDHQSTGVQTMRSWRVSCSKSMRKTIYQPKIRQILKSSMTRELWRCLHKQSTI